VAAAGWAIWTTPEGVTALPLLTDPLEGEFLYGDEQKSASP
jgi:hypothetical protein